MQTTTKAEAAFKAVSAGSLKTFSVEIAMTIGGQEYAGVFEMRYPTVKDDIKLGLEAAKLRGGVEEKDLDPMTSYAIWGLARLKVLCTSKPEWAKDFEAIPSDILLLIHADYQKQSDFFRDRGIGTDASNPTTA